MRKKLNKSEVGKLGGLARVNKHGNPGTHLGRIKGGLNAIKMNKKLGNNFKVAKIHAKPKYSGKLAEFMGIMFGDGHLSCYQILITTNSVTDLKHAHYIKSLIKQLFKIEASIQFKKNQNAINVVVSSVNLSNWLAIKGMPVGNKLEKGLLVPPWILKKTLFKKAFIRGLFDTDGCVFVDKHIIKGKEYRNYGWTITSYSDKLRKDVIEILTDLNFRPTCSEKQKSVYMRKKEDLERYFKEIGSGNEKHLERYRNGRIS